MKLELISHKHPLVFKEVQTKDGARIICNGCSKRVWGSHYSCKECNFDLHKSCAEQPRELKHPLHPKHPLTLFQGVWSWGKCGACNGELWGFSYHCSHCKFKLHFKCAVLPLSLEAESHDHPFTLVRKSVSFTCDACGKEGNGMFYLCAICPILVHLECAPLPLTVRHIRHEHPLSLAFVNQSDHPWICQLCVEKVDTNYRVYCCSNCHFVAHLNCATHNERFLRDEEPIESTPITENSELDESIDSLLSYVVKKIELGEDKIEKAVQIKHFSHEHDLELTDELETNEKCDACTRKIFSPFYSCAQCSFFLHKSCAELPRKKQHPLHRHPLSSSHRHLTVVASSYVLLARCFVMASLTIVTNVTSTLMSNAVCSQTALFLMVTSTNLFSAAHQIITSVVLVLIMEVYFGVLIVNLLWITFVLHCRILSGTNPMNSSSHFVIVLLRIVTENIIVIFVKKNETQRIGFITVGILVFLLIPDAFLGTILI